MDTQKITLIGLGVFAVGAFVSSRVAKSKYDEGIRKIKKEVYNVKISDEEFRAIVIKELTVFSLDDMAE